MIERIKSNLPEVLLGLLFSSIIAIAANMAGYDMGIMESIPGLLILAIICLIGYIIDWIVDIDKISSVLWISIVAIILASPISPFADTIIHYVDMISLNAVVTPILGYTGVIIAKDWDAFRKVGLKGVLVSIVVIIGTFLISSLLGDLFMAIF